MMCNNRDVYEGLTTQMFKVSQVFFFSHKNVQNYIYFLNFSNIYFHLMWIFSVVMNTTQLALAVMI